MRLMTTTAARLLHAVSATRFRLLILLLLLTATCVLIYYSPSIYDDLWFKPQRCRAYVSSSSTKRRMAVNLLISQSRISSVNRSSSVFIFKQAAIDAGVPGSLTTLAGPVRIYTHGWHDYISRSILSRRGWEDANRHAVERLLMADPSLQFLDFGSNIGAFALTAAKHRRKVVAVDANRRNLALLARSVSVNPDFSGSVTLINNALSNQRGKLILRENPVNIGGSGVNTFDSGDDQSAAVNAVMLDDLLSVIPFRRAIIKMDIEANEHLAMAGANQFFKQMDIPYILLEWSGQMEKVYENIEHPGAAFLYKFLKDRGYDAFGAVNGRRLADSFCRWPQDILLKKIR